MIPWPTPTGPRPCLHLVDAAQGRLAGAGDHAGANANDIYFTALEDGGGGTELSQHSQAWALPATLCLPLSHLTSWASRASSSSSMLLLTAMGTDSSQGTWNLKGGSSQKYLIHPDSPSPIPPPTDNLPAASRLWAPDQGHTVHRGSTTPQLLSVGRAQSRPPSAPKVFLSSHSPLPPFPTTNSLGRSGLEEPTDLLGLLKQVPAVQSHAHGPVAQLAQGQGYRQEVGETTPAGRDKGMGELQPLC